MRRKTVQSGSTEDFYCKKKKVEKQGRGEGRESRAKGGAGSVMSPRGDGQRPRAGGGGGRLPLPPGRLCVGCEVENKVIG